MESRSSEKERQNGGQLEGGGHASDAPHGGPFEGNFKTTIVPFFFPSGMMSWALGTAKTGKKRPTTQ
jgi:hypothetical protein